MNPATEQSTAAITVVTASDRLARHLHEVHADEQLRVGRVAWARPDILPVGAFWNRLADALRVDAAGALARRRVLSRSATLCRWEALVAASFADTPLLQTAGAARTALDAWLLCRDFGLDVAALAADPLEETRLLIAWGRQFESDCLANGWLPDYALPEAVLGALETSPPARRFLPATIELAGFMEVTPLDASRFAALRALGVAVEVHAQAEPVANARRLACEDVHAEHVAVAAWARARLHENARQRIAIVVPGLASRRAALRRELAEALAPQTVASFDNAHLPFNFSLGEPLAARALVADALALLALAGNRIEFATAARLCRSPYLAADADARLRLEAILRRDGYAQFTLGDWQFLAAREQCGSLARALEEFRAALHADGGEALPSEWARRFSHWLDVLGWCRGRTLDSDEYQAREAWNAQLGGLAELDIVLGRCNRATAFAWLNRFVAETPFQPRAVDAPVQVLGLLEATGMHFDALWVMGLTDDVLPAAPRPNPFLPVAVQRAKNLPQSSPQREQAFARQVLDGLRHAAPDVICSHALRDGDAEQGASPLLQDMPPAQAPLPYPSIAAQWFGAATLEAVIDDHGPPHTGHDARGGTALLQNQSHCAFRAFAIHRLGAADWPTPQPGPDAMIRGLLAHRALEQLWLQWRTRATLAQLHAAGELEAAVRATVAAVLEDSARSQRHRWRASLRELEQARLVNVLMRWFERIELPRADFEVVEVEGQRVDGSAVETQVAAGPLRLRGKLDRVDVLADGSEIIIDYKTGNVPAKNDFFGERPRAPQLPAYLLARRQAAATAPAAIAVASLKAGRESLTGVADTALAGVAGLVDVAKSKHVDDWQEAIAHWERAIGALGEGFAAGEARVEPLRGACDYCHLATLCRIHEQRRANAEDDND